MKDVNGKELQSGDFVYYTVAQRGHFHRGILSHETGHYLWLLTYEMKGDGRIEITGTQSLSKSTYGGVEKRLLWSGSSEGCVFINAEWRLVMK